MQHCASVSLPLFDDEKRRIEQKWGSGSETSATDDVDSELGSQNTATDVLAPDQWDCGK